MNYTNTIRCRTLLLVTAFFFILVKQGYGQETEELGLISTGRPDQTQGTTVVPKSTLQIETGFLYQKDKTVDQEVKTHSYPDIMLRYGLFETLELRLGGAFLDSVIQEGDSYRKVTGLGPLNAGFRLHLWDGAGILPQAAFTGTVALPVGHSNMTSSHTDTELRLALANTLTPDLSLTYTIGYGWVEEGTRINYAVSLGVNLSNRVSVYGEVFGANAEGSRATHQADAGLLYIFRRNMQLDIAAAVGLSPEAPDFFITTGYSVRLPH